MRRRLAIAALVVGVFAVVVSLTFPTDALVRQIVARTPLPRGLRLSFAAAHLSPHGLWLDDVHLVELDGRSAFDATRLRLRPSLWGFWRDRTGRPWSITAETCQGTIDVAVGVDGATTPVVVALDHVELASCLPYVMPRLDAYGRVTGTLSARLAPRDPPSGDGAVQLLGAGWAPGGPLEDTRLHADAATLRWRLADRRLELTTIEATSDDFRVDAHGAVRLLTPVDDSVLDLRLVVTPGKTMPPLIRRYVDGLPGALPDAQGTRTFHVQGTLREPRVVAVGPLEQ